MNEKSVYRTAPATTSLLEIPGFNIFCEGLLNKLGKGPKLHFFLNCGGGRGQSPNIFLGCDPNISFVWGSIFLLVVQKKRVTYRISRFSGTVLGLKVISIL